MVELRQGSLERVVGMILAFLRENQLRIAASSLSAELSEKFPALSIICVSPQCLLHPCPTCSKSRVLAAFANKQKGAKKEPWEASAFQVESEDKKLLDPASGQWSSAAMPTEESGELERLVLLGLQQDAADGSAGKSHDHEDAATHDEGSQQQHQGESKEEEDIKGAVAGPDTKEETEEEQSEEETDLRSVLGLTGDDEEDVDLCEYDGTEGDLGLGQVETQIAGKCAEDSRAGRPTDDEGGEKKGDRGRPNDQVRSNFSAHYGRASGTGSAQRHVRDVDPDVEIRDRLLCEAHSLRNASRVSRFSDAPGPLNGTRARAVGAASSRPDALAPALPDMSMERAREDRACIELASFDRQNARHMPAHPANRTGHVARGDRQCHWHRQVRARDNPYAENGSMERVNGLPLDSRGRVLQHVCLARTPPSAVGARDGGWDKEGKMVRDGGRERENRRAGEGKGEGGKEREERGDKEMHDRKVAGLTRLLDQKDHCGLREGKTEHEQQQQQHKEAGMEEWSASCIIPTFSKKSFASELVHEQVGKIGEPSNLSTLDLRTKLGKREQTDVAGGVNGRKTLFLRQTPSARLAMDMAQVAQEQQHKREQKQQQQPRNCVQQQEHPQHQAVHFLHTAHHHAMPNKRARGGALHAAPQHVGRGLSAILDTDLVFDGKFHKGDSAHGRARVRGRSGF